MAAEEELYASPALSSDGASVAVAREGPGGASEIGVYDQRRRAWTRTIPTADGPVWSSDGAWLYYLSYRSGIPEVYRTAVAGGPEEPLTRDGLNKGYLSATADGKALVFAQQGAGGGGWDLVSLSLETPEKVRPLLATPLPEWSPVLSPDGRWLAYVSHSSARTPPRVFVAPAVTTGAGVPVSPERCHWPRWARAGGELFFACGDELQSVSIGSGAQLLPGRPRLLFSGPFGQEYDVAPGGRFVMVQRSGSATEPHIVYAPRWLDEMKARYRSALRK